MKVGDKVKVIRSGSAPSKTEGKIGILIEDGHNTKWKVEFEESFFGDHCWYFAESDLLKIGGSMIDDLNVGDLLSNGRYVKKVLAKLDGVVLLTLGVDNDELDDDDDIKKAGVWYTEFELEEDDWEKYNPEVEEVTMDEVCEKFGKTVKIIKE
jgi:hypothetical protein